jgi:excisionase family DNA binding protein
MEKQGYREALERLDKRFPERDAISVKEAAVVLGISESTIRDAMKRKRDPFPSKKIGGRQVIPITQLARWMC